MGLVFFWTIFKVWIKWALESYLEDEIFVLLIAQYGCWLDSNFSLDFPGHKFQLKKPSASGLFFVLLVELKICLFWSSISVCSGTCYLLPFPLALVKCLI